MYRVAFLYRNKLMFWLIKLVQIVVKTYQIYSTFCSIKTRKFYIAKVCFYTGT